MALDDPAPVQVTPLSALLARQRAGFALDQGFYQRADIYDRDLDMLLDHWTLAGHVSSIPARGDYLVSNLGAESAIVVRGEDGSVLAFHNVCRHRGSRLCAGAGNAPALVCPYHGWTYTLEGRLKGARQMPDGFDAADYGLKPVKLAIIGGLIFLSFGENPPSLRHAEHAFGPVARSYGWESARVAATRSYTVASNWKLAMENYHECYHCSAAHPEFSHVHTLAKPKAQRRESEAALMARAPALGIDVPEFEAWAIEPDGDELVRVIRSTLYDGRVTGSENGRPVAPLMGEISAYDGGCTFGELGYLSAFLAYPDHSVLYRFAPRDLQQTDLDVIWLVRGDAVEGRDYDPERLVWLWDVTSVADKRIIEWNQAGVNSRSYTPGPFGLMESGARLYVERYVGEMRARYANPQ